MKSRKKFTKNLVATEQDLSDRHGDFSLFAACFREDTMYDTWDLVVSAPWLPRGTMDSYTLIMDGVRRNMAKDEMFDLHALPILEPDDSRIQEIQDDYEVEHGLVELILCQLFDMDMERVYIVTAKHRESPKAAEVV